MPSLAETQTRLRDAILAGDGRGAAPLLTGGRAATARFAIHMRHYEASLVSALLDKFPACVWLLGEPFVTSAARDFVHARPPGMPCIAEYGGDFPKFLANLPGTAKAPYVRAFAEAEWHLGHVSVAIDYPPRALAALAPFPAETLADVALRLQPGLAYVSAAWPIDELLRLFLSDAAAPDRYVLEPADIWLEIGGARGEFRFERLDAAEFAFRRALAEGASIGSAAEPALDMDADFDAGQALARLFATGLVIGFSAIPEGAAA
jgi:Putative DNA-binding domain